MSDLNLDVYIAPMRRMEGAPPQGADWIDGFGTRLIGMYITHGHSDHWTGLTWLRERFGRVPALARPKRERA